MGKIKILTLIDYYLPGYKAGGPLRTLENMTAHLSNDFSFSIITMGHDLGETELYPNIKPNKWYPIGNSRALYLNTGISSYIDLFKYLRNEPYNILYLNSFFSFRFSIYPLILLLLKLARKPKAVILAPRGEFSKGAIALKNFKKRLFVNLAKIIGLHHDITWQVSSKFELEDIQKHYGSTVSYDIAIDLPQKRFLTKFSYPKTKQKTKFKIDLFFLSRISRKKNLDYALNVLSSINGEINFDIFGPIEDSRYWAECEAIIDSLPPNILVNYKGVLKHENVSDTMRKYDLFFLPTHGENYGHVILESLLSGCPVLVSDQTPWQDLEKHEAGWDIPLGNRILFRNILEHCISMDTIEFDKLCRRAFEFGVSNACSNDAIYKNKQLFYSALKGNF